jgi:hypothetical protein
MQTLTQTRYWTLDSFFPKSVADPDPGSGAFLTPGSGMGKKSGSGSGMNNPDHIFECSNTVFKLFDADPGRKKLGSGIWNGKIRIPDPQHCFLPIIRF